MVTGRLKAILNQRADYEIRHTLTDDQRWQSVLARDSNADGELFSPCAPRVSFAVRLAEPDMLAGKCLLLRKCQRGACRWLSPCKRCQPDKANPLQHRLDKIPTPADFWNRKRL